jgi:hypothetical protein
MIPERRKKRTLTDEDINALAVAISDLQDKHCRYQISSERLESAVRFFENINGVLEDSKNVVRRALLTLVVVTLAGLVFIGAWYRLYTMKP